jgi:hypothetical protein
MAQTLKAKLQPVLLCGGSGTRLWPLSREAYPKQFLPLAGQDTMLQATWQRVAGIADAPPIVVAGEEHRFLVAEQLRQIGAPTPAIVLEPVGRNTAPAIAAAALQAMAGGDDPLLLVLPSFLLFGDAQKLPQTAVQWGVLVWMGLFATALGRYWWVKGSTRVDAGTLAIMNELHVPAGLLVNLLIWNRDFDLPRLAAGAAVILLAMALLRMGRPRAGALA